MSERKASIRRAILRVREAEPFEAGALSGDAGATSESYVAVSGHHYRPFFRESVEPGELNQRAL